MKEQDRKEIELKIDQEIINTNEIILEYQEFTKPISPENAIGRLSRMDAINNQAVTKAALKKAEEKLKGLNFLKSKISKEDFGLCHRCKNEIPLPRMLFIPQSPFCVNCAS